MIKFDTEHMNDGSGLKIEGTPEEIAIEVVALAKTIHDIMLDYNDEYGKEFELTLMNAVLAAFETDAEEKRQLIKKHEEDMKMMKTLYDVKNFLEGLKERISNKNESGADDIRRSEFDSDEEFMKWFRGTEGGDEE